MGDHSLLQRVTDFRAAVMATKAIENIALLHRVAKCSGRFVRRHQIFQEFW